MTKQNLNKSKWYVWFPYPSSWLKALFISIFFNVVIFIVKITAIAGYLTGAIINSPNTVIFFGIFALLTPIPLIAFAHHILNSFLSKYMPKFQTSEMKNTQGLRIKIFSWWEGLYGWLVILVSILIATALSIFILPLFNLDIFTPTAQYTSYQQQLITIFGIIFLVTAAFLYQFEYCFKRNLILVSPVNNQIIKNNSNKSSHINTDLNKLRGEMGLNQIKPNKDINQFKK